MNSRIIDSVASLRRTPDSLDAALRGRPEAWLDTRHVEDALSPREVVGHLIKGEEEDWIPRVKTILASGESVPFSPFEVYGANEYSHRTPLSEMLTRFRALRIANVEVLAALDLSDEMLDTKGTHPAHGQVTLEQLICTWAVHDLYHLGQIYKSFSANFLNRTGPWENMLNLPHFN